MICGSCSGGPVGCFVLHFIYFTFAYTPLPLSSSDSALWTFCWRVWSQAWSSESLRAVTRRQAQRRLRRKVWMVQLSWALSHTLELCANGAMVVLELFPPLYLWRWSKTSFLFVQSFPRVVFQHAQHMSSFKDQWHGDACGWAGHLLVAEVSWRGLWNIQAPVFVTIAVWDSTFDHFFFCSLKFFRCPKSNM